MHRKWALCIKEDKNKDMPYFTWSAVFSLAIVLTSTVVIPKQTRKKQNNKKQKQKQNVKIINREQSLNVVYSNGIVLQFSYPKKLINNGYAQWEYEFMLCAMTKFDNEGDDKEENGDGDRPWQRKR